MTRIAAVSAALCLSATALAGDNTGWSCELSTRAHLVSGTVTVVDSDTIRVDNFHYDGGGIVVYFYLAEQQTNASFANGLQIGEDLLGTPYNGESLVIDLPAGQSTADYNAVSVWCVAAGVSFGDGTFMEPPCIADLSGDGVLNGIDVGLFLSAYSSGDLTADLSGDGMLNGIDVGLFLSAYSSGC